jgi:hypothetical protein
MGQAAFIFTCYFHGLFFFRHFRTLSSNNALIEYDCCHLVVLRCIMCLMFNCFCILRSYLTKKTPIYKRASSASALTSQRTKISLDLYRHHDNPGVASLPHDITDSNGNPGVTQSFIPSNSDSRKGIARVNK